MHVISHPPFSPLFVLLTLAEICKFDAQRSIQKSYLIFKTVGCWSKYHGFIETMYPILSRKEISRSKRVKRVRKSTYMPLTVVTGSFLR